jgi:hypothetical protein
MDKGDYTILEDIIQSINWEENTKDMNIEETWDHFKHQYDKAVDICIPKYTAKTTKWRRPLWMNGKAIKACKKKYWAWKRYRNTGRDEDYERYCRKRNLAQHLNNKLRRDFEKRIAREAKTKLKAFWKYVKSQTTTREGLSPLEKPNGELTKNDTDKAQVLNTFFVSVFTQENKELIPKLTDRKYSQPIEDLNITYMDVEKALTKLKTDKSPGPDQIHPRVLKECYRAMKIPLTLIFRKSLEEGQVPSHWKDAHVIPIHKKGRKKLPNNYRPVSLTSIACKLMERLIRDKIMRHMEENKLFTDCQYGFRNKRSTVLQLLKVLDQWTELLDEGNCLDVLYLDFSKAFDTVPHCRLLNKLQAYGIKGKILEWVTDFLTNRRQRVSISGCMPQCRTVLK